MVTATEVTEFLLSMKVEALLVSLAGLMAITTAGIGYKNTHAQRYKLVVIGSNDVDVTGWCCLGLAVIGFVNLLAGASKSTRKYKMSFNKFVCLTVCTLFCNFCVAMAITEYKNRVVGGLEPSMLEQLKASVLGKQRFGVGFELSESWDFMQMKLLCCGVRGYKDYLELGGVGSVREDTLLPLSCCAMKASSPPEPDNVKQCQLDAKYGVTNSIFLHTQGCHSPISRWLIRHINKLSAMIFGTICLQALGILYLSWVGFRRSSSLFN